MQRFFREPIPEIFQAAKLLDGAVSAHLEGNPALADRLIRRANMPELREWTESVLGKRSPYVRISPAASAPSAERRDLQRMPNARERAQLHLRDGYHCRFCGIPVIRAAVRERIRRAYPDALNWSKRNRERHAAFFAMWAQYDHLIPHAKNGTNSDKNMVVACAGCNFGRGSYTLAEVGLSNPLDHAPTQSPWDGLERFSQARPKRSTTPKPFRGSA